MHLPKVITDLIEAQNNFDSAAYANCFAESGVMFDEGKNHEGRIEIRQMIEEANKKYRSVMKPIGYVENGNASVLSAEVSGTFDGSPLILKFHFEIADRQIQYLKVTG